MSRSIALAVALTATGLPACSDDENLPLDPETSLQTCILCGPDGQTLNPYLEQFRDEAYDDHNDGLEDVLLGLQLAAGGGTLSTPEAEAIAEPRIRDFLAARGYAVPDGYWTDVTEAQDRFVNGQDIVYHYGSGRLSTDALNLVRDLLEVVDHPDPRPTGIVASDLELLLSTAEELLYGEELEGFARVVGIAQGSNDYWRSSSNALIAWDAALGSADMSDVAACGWRMLGGDVIGGAFGFLCGGPIGGGSWCCCGLNRRCCTLRANL
ncbi:MAG: hypothetical protein RQ751_05125 [Longimicrobiales bacterium]|nr:hypothetical protein [Longimicrobiales bacterium]